MLSPLRCAHRSSVVALVVPCSVRLPVAFVVIGVRSAGIEESASGEVSSNVAVGYLLVSMMRPRNWSSRWDWSLATDAMSTVNEAFETLLPAMVIEPVTLVVRPAATVLCPKSTSLMR